MPLLPPPLLLPPDGTGKSAGGCIKGLSVMKVVLPSPSPLPLLAPLLLPSVLLEALLLPLLALVPLLLGLAPLVPPIAVGSLVSRKPTGGGLLAMPPVLAAATTGTSPRSAFPALALGLPRLVQLPLLAASPSAASDAA
jgi:hypothetical protein